MKILKGMVFLAVICGLTFIFSNNVESSPFRVSNTSGYNHRLMRTSCDNSYNSDYYDLYVAWVEDIYEEDRNKNILYMRHADVSGWVPKWDEPHRVAELPESINQGDMQICQGVSGNVYISWFDGEGLYLVYSNDYGETWSDQIQIDTEPGLHNVVDEDYASVINNLGIYEMLSDGANSVYFLYRIDSHAWAFKVLYNLYVYDNTYSESYTSFNNGNLRYATMCRDKNDNVYILNLKDSINGFRLTFYRFNNNEQDWLDEQIIYQVPETNNGDRGTCYYPRIACNDDGHVVIAWTWEGKINGVSFNQIMFQHSENYGINWLNTPSVISGINDYIELYTDGLIAYIVLYWESSAYLYKFNLYNIQDKNIPVRFSFPLARGGYKNARNNLLFSSADKSLNFVYFKRISGNRVVPSYNSYSWLVESENSGDLKRHKEITLPPIEHPGDISIKNNVLEPFAVWKSGARGSREEGVYLKYSDDSGETWQGDGIVSEEIYEEVKGIIKDIFDESEDNDSGILDGALDKFGRIDSSRTHVEGTMNGEQGNDYSDTLINIIYGKDEHRGDVKNGSLPSNIQPGGVTIVEDDEDRDIGQTVKDVKFNIDNAGDENDSWDIYENFRTITDGSDSDEGTFELQVPNVKAIFIGKDEEDNDNPGLMFDSSKSIPVCDKVPFKSHGNNSGNNINEELDSKTFSLTNISNVSKPNHSSKDALQNGVSSLGNLSAGTKFKMTQDGERAGGFHLPEQETRRENGGGNSNNKHISSQMQDSTNRNDKGIILYER